MESDQPFDIRKIASWMMVVAGFLVVLIYFQTFLKPIIVSIIIWFLVRQLRDFINRTEKIGIKLPSVVVNTFSLVLVIGAFYLVMLIIVSNIENFVKNFDDYSGNINETLLKIEELTGYDVHNETTLFKGSQFQNALTQLAGNFSAFIGKFFLVILYVAFIMMEARVTGRKLGKILDSQESGSAYFTVIHAIDKLFKDYVSIKIFTSFLTGALSFVVLIFLNVQLSGLWAFLIFLLNFIPSVGSMIATAFPALFMLLTTGSPAAFFQVLLGVGFIQILVGNVIEPRVMGDRLNLSPMVVIISLVFWGFIWGVIGMLLSVPFLAMQMIIFSQFQETRPIAIFLSRTGDIMPLVTREEYKSGSMEENSLITPIKRWFRKKRKEK